MINVTPGPDTMLVLRASVGGGRPRGLASAAGVMTGCLVWGLAAATGVTGLLAASHAAYDAVRIAGAAYLAWLGFRALWDARHPASADPALDETAWKASPKSRVAAFRAGLMTNLLNPKAGVFYMSLVPQFIPRGAPVFATALLLTFIDLGELALWYSGVIAAAARLADRIRRPSFRRRTEQASGVVLLGFAVGLAFDRGA
ncbi:MAG: LysE family translocator [Streptosporangiales bacterium]|nr:LysE family translocator [Streptosporangiales bacterium]